MVETLHCIQAVVIVVVVVAAVENTTLFTSVDVVVGCGGGGDSWRANYHYLPVCMPYCFYVCLIVQLPLRSFLLPIFKYCFINFLKTLL